MPDLNHARIIEMRLSAGHRVRIVSAGNCMEPFLRENDVLLVERKKSYSVGEVIVVAHEGRIVAHRVLQVGNRYRIKGDNSFGSEIVTYDSIYGSVEAVERDGKTMRLKTSAEEIQRIAELSLAVARAFVVNEYSVERTKSSFEYLCLRRYLSQFQ